MFTTLWNSPTPISQWAAVLCVALVAAIQDSRTGRISNRLTGSLLVAGAIWSIYSCGLAGLGDGAAGCILLAMPFIVLFLVAGGGAADAKLMGAVGMWLGVRNGVFALTCVLLAGAVMGLIYALMKKRFEAVFINLTLAGFGLGKLITRRQKWAQASEALPATSEMIPMPYGLSIFVGLSLAAWSVFEWKTGRFR